MLSVDLLCDKAWAWEVSGRGQLVRVCGLDLGGCCTGFGKSKHSWSSQRIQGNPEKWLGTRPNCRRVLANE